MRLPSLKSGVWVGAALVALAVGAAPLLVAGADHLDAPALGGLTNSAGDFAPHSDHGSRDINDVYAFEGSDPSKTVLVMTTNPAINLFDTHFSPRVRYIINVDRNGDAVSDRSYVWRFGPVSGGSQNYQVIRYRGQDVDALENGVVVASGSTAGDGTATGNSVKAFAGVRSDPFFFDLTGFVGTVFGVGTDNLGDDPTDFFAPLNTNALVIEVADGALGTNIGVWGVTQWFGRNGELRPGDQMGRPAINTVFNTSLVDPDAARTKNLFNRTPPSQQNMAYDRLFRHNIINTLMNINAALGLACDDYTRAEARGLANILLPDVLTYDTSTEAAGPLNGRALADDVIDAELGITTNGCVTSDGVDAHTDYLSEFPYLGEPHN